MDYSDHVSGAPYIAGVKPMSAQNDDEKYDDQLFWILLAVFAVIGGLLVLALLF
jgi:hypothetical protein